MVHNAELLPRPLAEGLAPCLFENQMHFVFFLIIPKKRTVDVHFFCILLQTTHALKESASATVDWRFSLVTLLRTITGVQVRAWLVTRPSKQRRNFSSSSAFDGLLITRW